MGPTPALSSHVHDLTLVVVSASSLEPPDSLDLNGTHPQRVKLTAPNISLSLDQSEGSVLSDDNLDSPDEIDINVDELDTPDEADSFEYTGHGKLPSWQGQGYVKSERVSKWHSYRLPILLLVALFCDF